MKIWYGYGSEHSANLVMIGQFKTSEDAAKAHQVIELLRKQVEADREAGLVEVGERTERFSDGMLDVLERVNVHSIGAAELEQFIYDVAVRVEGDKVVVTTEEVDVSAFLKVLFDKGAHIEVYSAHDYPDTGHGRGR